MRNLKLRKERKEHRGRKQKGGGCVKHLSVQACRHRNDASRLIVDGEHVGGWTLGVLSQDLVTQHPISCFRVVFVNSCDGHNKCSCGMKTQYLRVISRYVSSSLLDDEKHEQVNGNGGGFIAW